MKVGVEEGTAALDRERVRVEKLLTDRQITVYCCPMFIMNTYFDSDMLRINGLFQIRKPSTVHCVKNNLNLCIKRSLSRLEPRQQYNFGLGLLT